MTFVLAAGLIAVSGAALAQGTAPGAPANPEAADPLMVAVETAAMAFGQCIVAGMTAVPESVAAQAGAAQVLGGCESQKAGLIGAVEALIATLPEAQRIEARAQMRTQMAETETEIGQEIERRRAVAAAAQ